MRSILLTILLWAFATIAPERRRPLDGRQGPGTKTAPRRESRDEHGGQARGGRQPGVRGGRRRRAREPPAAAGREAPRQTLPGRCRWSGPGRRAPTDRPSSGPSAAATPACPMASSRSCPMRRGCPYRFVWIVEPWFDPSGVIPFIAVVVAINAIMGAALAFYLSHPLRRLRRVMDRFGRGDLRARVGSRRRDEIGAVSREFDLLAERVETLMTAERRLLQDVSHELRSPLARLGCRHRPGHQAGGSRPPAGSNPTGRHATLRPRG